MQEIIISPSLNALSLLSFLYFLFLFVLFLCFLYNCVDFIFNPVLKLRYSQ